MAKSMKIDDYVFKVICPTTNKTARAYDYLVEIANELHTDFPCQHCGRSHTMSSDLIEIEKK